jgi:hypothetical protein
MGIWFIHYSMTLPMSILTVNARLLSARYIDKLFITCAYDAEHQLLSLSFIVGAEEETIVNWGWSMQ